MADIRHTLGLDADQMISSLGQAQTSTLALGAALAATAAAVTKGMRDAIKYGDALGKMSERTGIAVETLSSLKLAAENSDTSLKTLARGVSTLSKGLFDAAKRGTGPAADALGALGIAATNASGDLRDAEDVLRDVSAAFAEMEDGTDKAAIAAKLFGGAGRELIPFLNQSREQIDLLAAKSRALGVIWTDESSQAAEDFGDSLNVLKTAGAGIFSQAAQFWIPTLRDIAGAFEAAALKAAGFAGTAGLDDPATFAHQLAAAQAALAKNTKLLQIAKENLNFAESEGSGLTQYAIRQARERVSVVQESVKANNLAIEASKAAIAAAPAEAAAAEEINAATAERLRLSKLLEGQLTSTTKAETASTAAVATHAAAIVAITETEREAYIRSADQRQREAERIEGEGQSRRLEQEQDFADDRVRVERAVSGTMIALASSVADSLIGVLRDLNQQRTEDAKERRNREIGLAILLGEIQAGLAFATTLAQFPGGATPAAYVAAAAAAAAVGVATKAAAAAGAASSAEFFHDGGQVMSDEVTIRARRGEVVLANPAVRALGGAENVERMASSGAAGPVVVVQKLDHRVVDIQTHRAIRRSGSPLDSALRSLNPRGTGRRNPYSART